MNFAAGTYIDTPDQFYQLQQMPKQHFMSTPEQLAQELAHTTPELAFNEAQRLADLEKLSNEYTPEYTV